MLPLTSAAAPAAGDGVAVGKTVSVSLLSIDEREDVDLLLGPGMDGSRWLVVQTTATTYRQNGLSMVWMDGWMNRTDYY